MKVVIVADVPGDWLQGDVCVSISHIGDHISGGMSFNTKLKPMPEKKTYTEADFWSNAHNGDIHEIEGYNKCIDDIEGS